ncbi:MAG: adenine deaminase [Candidatus Bipolaricaulota bacterium]
MIDLAIRGGCVFDVFTGRFVRRDLAIDGGTVVGFSPGAARETIDARGRIVIPGLVDAHVHLESSHLTPAEFARAVVPHGTTTVVADPHEVANVCGLPGTLTFVRATAGLPLRVRFMAPSCVPASPFQTSSVRLGPEETRVLLAEPGVIGLAEVMNVPGVLAGDAELMAKLSLAAGKPIDGHAPGLSGGSLAEYVAAGPSTDHECTRLAEAAEKLAHGMHILLREAAPARNLDDLLPLLDERTAPFVHFATDDRSAAMLADEGHVDGMVRRAVAAGVAPETALAAATLHAARTYGLRRVGALAPGYAADALLVSSVEAFDVDEVVFEGRIVARGGELLARAPEASLDALRNTIHLAPWPQRPFSVAAPRRPEERLRVIGAEENQIVTQSLLEPPLVRGDEALADPERDLAKAAVVDRTSASGAIGVGFVRGFGLRAGALASTVAHDAHPLVVLGVDDDDMRLAADVVAQSGGGQAVVRDGEVLALLPLPLAGLLSTSGLAEVARAEHRLREAAHELGSGLPEPFMTLSFLALPVVPHLKLSDLGLVDVDAFRVVPPYAE